MSRLNPLFWRVNAKLKILRCSAYQLSNGFACVDQVVVEPALSEDRCGSRTQRKGFNVLEKAARESGASKFTVRKAKAALEFLACVTSPTHLVYLAY